MMQIILAIILMAHLVSSNTVHRHQSHHHYNRDEPDSTTKVHEEHHNFVEPRSDSEDSGNGILSSIPDSSSRDEEDLCAAEILERDDLLKEHHRLIQEFEDLRRTLIRQKEMEQVMESKL